MPVNVLKESDPTNVSANTSANSQMTVDRQLPDATSTCSTRRNNGSVMMVATVSDLPVPGSR